MNNNTTINVPARFMDVVSKLLVINDPLSFKEDILRTIQEATETEQIIETLRDVIVVHDTLSSYIRCKNGPTPNVIVNP